MTNYKNLGGNSAVVAYEYGNDYIIVQFKSGQWTLYTYTYGSAGAGSIERMKELADAGSGLGSFISTNKPPYSQKK